MVSAWANQELETAIEARRAFGKDDFPRRDKPLLNEGLQPRRRA